MAAESGQQPIKQLRGLFESVARDVVASQARLDALPPTPAGPLSSAPTAVHYSIPRADVSLSFGLEETNNRRFLIPFFRSKSKRLQIHAHELSFSVVAVPEPPPPPRGAPDTPGDVEGTLFPVTLTQPHFFVPLEEQKDLCRRLATAMEKGRWDFVYPEHGNKPKPEKVIEEAQKIRDNIEPENPVLGMVVFELDTSPQSFLIVRVTGKGKQDGVFVFQPGQQPEALIYSFDDDHLDNIRYKALHDFALTVRHWLSGAAPRRLKFMGLDMLPEVTPNGLGLLALSEFTSYLTEGYLAALRYVSAPAAPGAPPAPLVDIAEVRAQLRYSVYYDEEAERLRMSFGLRRQLDGAPLLADGRGGDDHENGEGPTESDEEVTVIESRTIIRATRDDEWPRVEVELVAPEFSLSGDARQFVIATIADVAADISKKLDKDEPDFYTQFLEGDTYQRGAVIFLSYEGNIPKQEFLVIWPGFHGERPRDFVFTCKLKERKIDVGSVKLVLSLKQTLEETGVAIGVELSGDEYEPFHNFFHAVRMWLSRTDRERSENRT